MEFVIPWPISTNAIWRRAGRIVHKSARYKRFTKDVTAALIGLDYKKLTGKVEVWITLYPPNKKEYDCDNYVKSVLDAFTQCGVWEDDSQVFMLHVAKGSILKGGCAVVVVEEIQGTSRERKRNAQRHCETRGQTGPAPARRLWD